MGQFNDFVLIFWARVSDCSNSAYKKILDLDLRFREPVLGLIDLKNQFHADIRIVLR